MKRAKRVFEKIFSRVMSGMAAVLDVDDELMAAEVGDDGYRDFWGLASTNEPFWQDDMLPQNPAPVVRVLPSHRTGGEPERRRA